MGVSEQINQLKKELYVDFIPAANKFKEDIKNGIRTEEEYLEWLRSFRPKK